MRHGSPERLSLKAEERTQGTTVAVILLRPGCSSATWGKQSATLKDLKREVQALVLSSRQQLSVCFLSLLDFSENTQIPQQMTCEILASFQKLCLSIARNIFF